MRDIPTVEDLTIALSGLTDLINDRTKLISAYFSEDKYKDFLLGERLEDIVEADRRDDRQTVDLKSATGYDVLKQKTSLTKFSNFLSPSEVQSLTLEPIDLTDVVGSNDPLQPQQTMSQYLGLNNPIQPPASQTPPAAVPTAPATASSSSQSSASPAPPTGFAEGGVVFPNLMPNYFNNFTYPFNQTTNNISSPSQEPQSLSLEKSGFIDKRPGQGSPFMNQISEDLGFEELRKSLGDAMKLPIQAVAAGLLGLLGSLPVPDKSPFKSGLDGTISKLASTFDLPNINLKTINLTGTKPENKGGQGGGSGASPQVDSQQAPPNQQPPAPEFNLPPGGPLPPGTPAPPVTPGSSTQPSATSAGATPQHQGPVVSAASSTGKNQPRQQSISQRIMGAASAAHQAISNPVGSLVRGVSGLIKGGKGDGEVMDNGKTVVDQKISMKPMMNVTSDNVSPYIDSTSYTRGDNFFNLTESVILEQQSMIAQNSIIPSSFSSPAIPSIGGTKSSLNNSMNIGLESDVEVSDYFLASVNQSPFV